MTEFDGGDDADAIEPSAAEAFLNDLAAAHPGKAYTALDRYRDFRAVFLGSEPGRRVLYEILSYSRMFRSTVVGRPVDPYAVMLKEGGRVLGLRILTVLNHEPPQSLPDRAASTQPIGD